jgi:hypothetical protein
MSMAQGDTFSRNSPASRPSASTVVDLDRTLGVVEPRPQGLDVSSVDRDFCLFSRARTATASSVDLIVTDPDLFSEIRAIGDAGGSVFPISRDRSRSEIKTCPATLDQKNQRRGRDARWDNNKW